MIIMIIVNFNFNVAVVAVVRGAIGPATIIAIAAAGAVSTATIARTAEALAQIEKKKNPGAFRRCCQSSPRH